jgi:hypothetical protein
VVQTTTGSLCLTNCKPLHDQVIQTAQLFNIKCDALQTTFQCYTNLDAEFSHAQVATGAILAIGTPGCIEICEIIWNQEHSKTNQLVNSKDMGEGKMDKKHCAILKGFYTTQRALLRSPCQERVRLPMEESAESSEAKSMQQTRRIEVSKPHSKALANWEGAVHQQCRGHKKQDEQVEDLVPLEIGGRTQYEQASTLIRSILRRLDLNASGELKTSRDFRRSGHIWALNQQCHWSSDAMARVVVLNHISCRRSWESNAWGWTLQVLHMEVRK